LGTATLDANGMAGLSTSSLTVGVHTITAAYQGDGSFNGSTSPDFLQTVLLAATTTTLTSAPNPSPFGQPVVFTARVNPNAVGAGVPTGTVTFFDGTTAIGTATLVAGVAEFATAALSLGCHSVTAVYNPDPGFGGSTSNVLTQAVGTPNQLFVGQLYLDVLERGPDVPGLNGWVAALDSGALSRSEVAASFWASPEHRELEVDEFYQIILGRPADPAGRTFWVNALLSGLGEGQVVIAFLTSPEYTLSHPTNVSYVQGLYQVVLERAPDAPGLSFWTQILTNGARTRADVAFYFLSSDEGYDLAISQSYNAFLHRNPDPVGQQFFFTAFATGTLTPTSFAAAILGSNEYFALSQDVCP
jgi:hypothetical protein